MRSSGFDPVSVEILNSRLRKVTVLVIVVFAVLVLRLWFLQIVHGRHYRVESENNRIQLQDIPPFRGMVFDRHGELLVDNRPSYNLSIIPEQIQDHDGLLKSIYELMDLSPDAVQARLKKAHNEHPFKPILIKKNLTRDELAVIETYHFNLPGVMIEVKPQRHYIFGDHASHLIGYLGEISEKQLASGRYPDSKPGDLIGKYGVEGKWQTDLNGLRGGEQIEVDAAGRKLRVISRKGPVPGYNVSLTIDTKLQLRAEELLKGKRGAIVAMNPFSGEILAMASSPTFDPNLFVGGIDEEEWNRIATRKDSPLQNRAISGQYPPGSLFKIVVALAGLEEGVIDPREEILCTGSYTLGNRTYRCWKEEGHGRISFHRALVESCDVYFYQMGRRLGVDKISQYAKMLGLGKKTGFALDYEEKGLVPSREWKLKKWGVPWETGETLSMAIGQTFVLVTPLQVVRMISAIFNGGYLYEPKVIEWAGKDDKTIYRFTPTLVDQVKAKEENMELIRSALVGAVNEVQGTGSRAKVKDLLVAGKTGTAQVINLEMEKNFEKQTEMPKEFVDHAWFMAVAPAEKPQLALAILIEHGGHGGTAAAPVAQELIRTYFGKN